MDPRGEDDQRLLSARVFALVRAIPRGRVASYGQLGAACDPPISGYICGRVLGRLTEDVPWWRIVAKDGTLPIRKRAPHLEAQQRATLEAEGVVFTEEHRVDMTRCSWDFRGAGSGE